MCRLEVWDSIMIHNLRKKDFKQLISIVCNTVIAHSIKVPEINTSCYLRFITAPQYGFNRWNWVHQLFNLDTVAKDHGSITG